MKRDSITGDAELDPRIVQLNVVAHRARCRTVNSLIAGRL